MDDAPVEPSGGDPNEIVGELRIEFDTVEEAERIAGALGVDDDDYAGTRVEGSAVIGEFRSRTVEGLRRASDDWMACLMAIVKG